MDALPDILTDPMLSRFCSEAAQAEETGWFWKYKVSSVDVCFTAAHGHMLCVSPCRLPAAYDLCALHPLPDALQEPFAVSCLLSPLLVGCCAS